jgi:hypothetical protein
MAADKLGLLTAAFLLCTPYGVLAQGTGGVSGGVSNGVGIGRVSIGIGTGGVPTGVGTGGVSTGIGTGGVSSGVGTGGVFSGVGTGSLGGGSLGRAAAPSSVGSVVGNATSLPPSTVHSGNSPFQNSIGIGQIAPSAVPANTAQPGSNLANTQQPGSNLGTGRSSTPR